MEDPKREKEEEQTERTLDESESESSRYNKRPNEIKILCNGALGWTKWGSKATHARKSLGEPGKVPIPEDILSDIEDSCRSLSEADIEDDGLVEALPSVAKTTGSVSDDDDHEDAEDSSEDELTVKSLRSGKTIYQPSLEKKEDFKPPFFSYTVQEKVRIANALLEKLVYANLTPKEIMPLVTAFEKCKFQAGETIIKQGDPGDYYYVVQSGQVAFFVNGCQVGQAGRGASFGELALLYTCPRAATVTALEDTELFCLEQTTFRYILQSQTQAFEQEKLELLQGVPFMSNLTPSDQHKLAHVMTPRVFQEGEELVRKGNTGNAFYVLQEGQVLVKDISVGSKVFKDHTLGRGEYFGERALVTSEPRAANVVAVTKGMAFLIERETFERVLGSMSNLILKDEDERREPPIEEHDDVPLEPTVLQTDVELNELERHKILGEGTLGQVWLVSESLPDRSRRPYALKIQSKYELTAQRHVKTTILEKEIQLKMMNHPFIINLFKTYQDEAFIYMLLEFHRGGELFTVMYPDDTIQGLPESQVKFYSAGIADALAYMHREKVVFRDLKPENVMMDRFGYPIVIDFGLAKYVPDNDMTYTLCGTPRFLAPEMITNHGHNCSADHWQLGILIYEMTTGQNPFSFDGIDQMLLFESIVKDDYEEPEKASDALKDIISKFLVKDPTLRLGSLARGEDDIFEHKWLRDVELHKLRRREIEAPWIPQIKDELDTGCFDDWSHLDDITMQDYGRLDPKDTALFEGF